MSDAPPLPSAANCLTPLIDSLVADKTERLDHINYGDGRWSDALAGWKAQANLNLRRVADEMMQSRLSLASGQGLRALAASKFFANVQDLSTAALGVIHLQKPLDGSLGSIPAGTRFRRQADPRAYPLPLTASDYLSTQDVNVRAVDADVYVPIRAVQTGVLGNIVQEVGVISGSDLTIVDQLFTRNFTVIGATCAGGGTTFSDPEVRAIAGAQPQGRRGPTQGAVLAGSYFASGVRHVAVFQDNQAAETIAYLADESWASDTGLWSPEVIQSLQDEWVGFGCALNPAGTRLVNNYFAKVACTVQLRDASLLGSTPSIQASIFAKVKAYFDERPDWYTFRYSSLRGVIARADPRILTCTSVTMTDRFGVALSEPTIFTTPPATLPHYYLLTITPSFGVPQ